MASLVSVKFNLDAVIRQLGLTMNRAVAVGCMRALNKTAASEQVALARAVAEDMGTSVSTAKAAMTVEKATTANLAARVVARGKRIPLIEFSASGPEPSRGKGRGVSYRIGSGGRQRIPSGFIARVGSGGHRGVFVRRGKKRVPIVERFGPSIAHVFEQVAPVGEQRRTEVLLKNLRHEIEFALGQSA